MVDLMAPQDLPFAIGEARERPMHVGGLQIFTPPSDAGPDYIRDAYESALSDPRELHPLLCRRPGQLPIVGRFSWEKDRNIDLGYHVRHTGLPRPGRIRELLEVVGRLHGTLLDRNRPLWESHLIEGLDDGRFAVYTKVHHSLVDGVSAMRLLQDALSTDPLERDMPAPWAARSRIRESRIRDEPDEHASIPTIERYAADLMNGAAGALKTGFDALILTERLLRTIRTGLEDHAAMLPYQAPRSILNVPLTGARRFAADSWDIDRIRAAAKANGGTVNDVVLTMCGGALRLYLQELDALPDDPLVAMVPVSLRSEASSGGGNSVGIILANLGTEIENATERFEVVKRSMDHGKSVFEGLSPTQVMALSALSFLPLAAGPLFRFERFRRPPFNVTVSNVPGPKEQLYWNGAHMDGSYPVSIPFDGQALNITVSSSADQLSFGLIGCRRGAPSLQRILGHLETALSDLESA